MTAHAEELIDDIRNGTVERRVPAGGHAAPSSAQGLVARIRAAPTSSQRILRTTGRARSPSRSGRTCASSRCWKGGTMPLYLRKLPDALRRRARPRPRLHGERGPRRDAARQRRRRRRPQRHEPLLRVRPRGGARRPGQRVPDRATSSSRTASTSSTSRPRPASTATTSTTSSAWSTSTATRR